MKVNNKIAEKLVVYSICILLLFSLMVGVSFLFLFKNYTIRFHKKDLEMRAVNISSTLTEYMQEDNNKDNSSCGHGMEQRGNGFGTYVKLIDDVAMGDVWIIDANLNLITTAKHCYSYAQIPQDAEQVISSAFNGNTTFSESFSELLQIKSITVGTPIFSSDKDIIGVVLMHSPVEDIVSSTKDVFGVLSICLCVAMILSVIFAIRLSLIFIKPLEKLKITAQKLIAKQYTAKSGVSQNDEIGELAIAIDTLSERLHDASLESGRLEQMRKDFISNISHELRTPVTVIRGSLEAICDGIIIEPKVIEQYHQQMLSETIALQRLMNDFLELSKLEHPDFKIEMLPFNICDLLEDTVRSMGQVARQKSVGIELMFETKEFIFVGDYGRIKQMFMIVIDNSIKFSSSGQKVLIVCKQNCVSISDSGIGMSKEQLSQIFQRFFTKGVAGNGLGLAIARQIADRHKIEINVDSVVNKNTTFLFIFPTKLQ